MAPVENITSETNDQQTAISINKICAQSSCEPQPNLDTAGTEINVNGLVESIKKMVGDSELKLAGYNIGITLNSTRRQGQYRGVGMKYFKVLCSSLSSYEAIAIEEIVHTELTHNQSSITYRKYRANACGRYRANLGGRRHTKEKIYDFYIAWWQEGEPGFSR
jgi:hypothetical protein